MPKAPLLHSNERVDKIDLDYAAMFGRSSLNLVTKKLILDQQDRIVEGFRVELPDQNSYPGRLVVHGGVGFNRDGQLVFTEDQIDITRDLTLEGVNTTFYLEIEFFESESDVDSRAFWDATVDQGTDPSGDPKPNGQEFFANVATRKTPDWRIVQPVSTTGFQRDAAGTVSSTRIPLLKVTTNSSNKITLAANPGLTTEAAATTLLEVISTSSIRVQDATLFYAGHQLVVDYDGTPETVTIATMDPETGVIYLTGPMAGTHVPGEIVRALLGSVPIFITNSPIGRYRRPSESNVIDYRDLMFQGDEAHGDILSRSHDDILTKSDTNLKSLKDYVDFLAGQIEEMKWGHKDPFLSPVSSSRIPVGVNGDFAYPARYFDRVSGLVCGRVATVTIGDGTSSFGDLNSTDETAFITAFTSLASTGGLVFVKRGVYSFTADVTITCITGCSITVVFEDQTRIVATTGHWIVNSSGGVYFKNMWMTGTATDSIGISVETTAPDGFGMSECILDNCTFDLKDVALPYQSSFVRCRFVSWESWMTSLQLFRTLAYAGAQVSGVFDHCSFINRVGQFLGGSCVWCDGTNTNGMSLATFKGCWFESWGLNIDMINPGVAPNLVHFDSCKFGSLLTFGHISLLGGTNITSTNCVGMDAAAAHITASDVTHMVIDSYYNNNSTGFAGVSLTDCNDVEIKNSQIMNNSGTSLIGAAVKVHVTNGNTVKNVQIHDNHFSSSDGNGYNKTVGVYVTGDGGGVLRNIGVFENTMEDFEIGICLKQMSSSVQAYDIKFNNNKINGQTGSALNAKCGIFVPADDSALRVWDIEICGNRIRNMYSNSANLSGMNNSGIWETGCWNVKVNDNTIMTINQSGSGIYDATGMRVGGRGNGEACNNIIDGVIGSSGSSGIEAGGPSAATLANWRICGNVISDINLWGGTPFFHMGIHLYTNADQVEISDNVITGWQFPLSSPAIVGQGECFIGTDPTIALTSLYGVTIKNNICQLGSNPLVDLNAYLATLYATSIVDCAIEGNVMYCGSGAAGGKGIKVSCTSGTNISICDNTLTNVFTTECIKVVCLSTSNGLKIDQNKMVESSIGSAFGDQILVTGPWNYSSISGNSCRLLTAGSNSNIHCTGVQYMEISGNTCSIHASNTIENILMDGTSGGYLISKNILTGGNGVAPCKNIGTSGATGAKKGFVEGNLYEIGENLRGADWTADNKQL